MAETTLDLTGEWQFKEYPLRARRMRDLDEENWLKCKVPSSIFSCLIENGIIEEANLLRDPDQYRFISEKPWIFQKHFDVSEDILNCDRIDLVLEGLDTIATIWLNDKLLARTENMFIAHRVDITKHLRAKDNRLLIKFDPARSYAAKLMGRYGKFSAEQFRNPERVYIRKAQYQFGWDFCPALEGCGIYRGVKIEGTKKARIENVHFRTIDIGQSWADVKVASSIKRVDVENCYLELTISDGEKEINERIDFSKGELSQSLVVHIKEPKLWWPRGGYGEQNLYRISCELFADGESVDRVEQKFGLRTVKLNRSKDKIGESFTFEVNNRDIYVKGANWVPMSMFPGSQRAEDYERLIGKAAEGNINLLRVWGGGYYEDEAFYRVCDELGILVWQDFMFACGYYPDRSWFLDEVKKEAEQIVKRLRNHPCICLWCGNNEIGWMHNAGLLGKGKKFYGKTIFEDLLPGVLCDLDADRDYIATTPFSVKSTEPNSAASGTRHEWSVWSGNEPVRNYHTQVSQTPRFVAEFGMGAIPGRDTLEKMCGAGEVRIGSYELEKHNYQLDGMSRIYRYSSDLFGMARDVESLVYFSQLSQARGAKICAENLRTRNKVNSGAILWQFNGSFPAIDFSAIDALGSDKALYYYMKRFYSPVMVAMMPEFAKLKFDEPEVMTDAGLVVINDSAEGMIGNLECRLFDVGGELINRSEVPVTAASFSKSRPWQLPREFVDWSDRRSRVLSVVVNSAEGEVCRNVYLFCEDKFVNWQRAEIKYELCDAGGGDFEIVLSSDTPAKDVYIELAGNGVLSDNFIDILPGDAVRVKVTAAAGINKDDIKITSVNDKLG